MIIPYLVITVLFFILCMVILCKENIRLTGKIIASLMISVAWPLILLALFLRDLKAFIIYLWSKIKK